MIIAELYPFFDPILAFVIARARRTNYFLAFWMQWPRLVLPYISGMLRGDTSNIWLIENRWLTRCFLWFSSTPHRRAERGSTFQFGGIPSIPGGAWIRSMDESDNSADFISNFEHWDLPEAYQTRADGVCALASTMGIWLGGPNQAAIDCQEERIGDTVYILWAVLVFRYCIQQQQNGHWVLLEEESAE